MRGRKPTTDEKRHMQKVAELNCIVCELFHFESSPAEIHHLNGKTRPGAHFKVIPLCFLHHNSKVDCDKYTSRHPHRVRFENRYGTEAELLEIVNNKIKG